MECLRETAIKVSFQPLSVSVLCIIPMISVLYSTTVMIFYVSHDVLDGAKELKKEKKSMQDVDKCWNNSFFSDFKCKTTAYFPW